MRIFGIEMFGRRKRFTPDAEFDIPTVEPATHYLPPAPTFVRQTKVVKKYAAKKTAKKPMKKSMPKPMKRPGKGY